VKEIRRDGITEKLVEKYRMKGIRSVIHFRRIMEAFELNADNEVKRKAVIQRLREYLDDVQFETRKAFDEFVMDSRRIQNAINTCQEFTIKLEHAVERDKLIEALKRVKEYVEDLLQKLEGSDQPIQENETQDEESE
jgi:hypothetical protein